MSNEYQKICPHCDIKFLTKNKVKIFCGDKCKRRFWDKIHSEAKKIKYKTRKIEINNCRICRLECRNFERSDPLCKICKKKICRRVQNNKSINTEDVLKDENEFKNRKIGHLDKHGYNMISGKGHPNSEKGGRIRQHILNMSNHIGRSLYKHENVHHINGIRDDNRIENLELWSTSQPSGQRVEDKIKWCKQFLKEYEK